MNHVQGNGQAELLRRAHAACDEQRFGTAFDAFTQAEQLGTLSTDDVLAFGDAAWWLGRSEQALRLAERGQRELLARGEVIRAAKEAINLGFLLMIRGELAGGSGWVQRGRSWLQRTPGPAAQAYVAALDAQDALAAGDLDRAIAVAGVAAEAASEAGDQGLRSLALMTAGTARLRAGAVAEAMAVLDEAMVAVRAGQVPPDVAGNLYCQMIAICWELADLRRAREWTASTERWCAGFDSSVMFSGICRMHRVQLRQIAGEWDAAAAGAQVVCTELAGMNAAVVAEGHYLLGDLLRLRGRSSEAGAAYQRARELGRDPQPGLALLMTGDGRASPALASLRTSLAAYGGSDYGRAPLLRALVEVALEADDVGLASRAAEDLGALARRWRSEGLQAAAAHARGWVALASGEPLRAVTLLREAVTSWRDLEAPYEGARARTILAAALAALGDATGATLEREVAATTLRELDAVVDLQRLAARGAPDTRADGLTTRETEILRLVAEGLTNRQVAQTLVISEKTVARHLANVYLKVGVSTRTGAVAWARRHGLRPGD